MGIATLTERRGAERQRRLAAIAVIEREIADYAHRKGGRFILFGSYSSRLWGQTATRDLSIVR